MMTPFSRHIALILSAAAVLIGCERQPVADESWKPEVVSINVTSEADSVMLTAMLKGTNDGIIECGFYVGPRMDQLERIKGRLDETSFTATLQGLAGKTQYTYIAFISNGENEILSQSNTFTTEESDRPKPSDPSMHIVFEDEVMKELCINAFDTDKDSNVSYSEAAAVTDLRHLELTKKTFRSFDELQYFTSVEVIPAGLFEGTGITSITFPESLSKIEKGAFKECRYLERITFSAGLEYIGIEAFYGCGRLKDIEISGKGKGCTIDNRAFASCTGLKEVRLLEGVTNINDSAFSKCSALETVTVPGTAAIINSDAFLYTSVKTVRISDLTKWMALNFANSAANPLSQGAALELNGKTITDLQLPENVTQLKNYTFSGCTSITSLTIPESISSIGRCAFFNCTGLKEVHIPASVNVIRGMAFYCCKSLTEVYLKAELPPLLDEQTPSFYPFDENAQERVFYVPAASAETYRSDSGWKYYTDYIKEYNY